MQSTLVKLTRTDTVIGIRTITRTRKSPHTFYIRTHTQIRDIRDGKACTTKDLRSFAELYPDKNTDTLTIRFTWLTDNGDGILSGWNQDIDLSLTAFLDFVDSDKESISLLAKRPPVVPKLDFSHSKETLHRVVTNPVLRRPFSRALARSFGWIGAKRIEFFPDWEPDGFAFKEILPGDAVGLCGGLLRSGDTPERIRYSVHT